jgi:hypothetical protein
MTRDECLQIIDEICTDMALAEDDSRGAAIRAAVAELSWGWSLNGSRAQLGNEIAADTDHINDAFRKLRYRLIDPTRGVK